MSPMTVHDIWDAKVQYGQQIGYIFAYSSPDFHGMQQSRVSFQLQINIKKEQRLSL